MRNASVVAFFLAFGGVPALIAAPAAGGRLTPRVLRQIVAEKVVGRRTIASLVPRSPVLGGRWFVASAHDVRYVAPGVVAIDYEDGHVAGRLVVRVPDPNTPRTWVVLEDRER